jgi:hypothetical protein
MRRTIAMPSERGPEGARRSLNVAFFLHFGCSRRSILFLDLFDAGFRYKEEQELSKTCTFKPNVEQTGTKKHLIPRYGSVLF